MIELLLKNPQEITAYNEAFAQSGLRYSMSNT